MEDFAFINAVDSVPPRGWRKAIVPVRRVVRRVLRPIFLRQSELFATLAARIDSADRGISDLHLRVDSASDQLHETIAFGWDYAAMARRLAALEDRVEALQSAAELHRDDDRQMALPFPDRESDSPRPEAGSLAG